MTDVFFRKRAQRLDAYIGYIALFSVFVYAAIVAHHALRDFDIWLHLKTGEIILQTGGVPARDMYSFTAQGKLWINHEWLFQVAAHLIFKTWGAEGLIMAQAALAFVSLLIIYAAARRTVRLPLEISCVMLLALMAMRTRINIRPDMASLCFFAAFLYILRFRLRTRLIWLLPLLQAVWVNVHGYFFLGPLLIFLFWAGGIIERVFLRPSTFNLRPIAPIYLLKDRDILRLASVACLSVCALLINPYGLRGAAYPVFIVRELLSGANRGLFGYVDELRNIYTLRLQSLMFYHVVTFLCAGCMLADMRRLKPVEIMLFLFFLCFSLPVRNVAFSTTAYCFIFMPYLGRMMLRLRRDLKALCRHCARFYGARWIVAVCFITLNVYAAAAHAALAYYDARRGAVVSMISGVDGRLYPEGAVDLLAAAGASGGCFNDFSSGAYIIFSLFPRYKVFIDGRTELYGMDILRGNAGVLGGDMGLFEELEARYGFDAVLCGYKEGDIPGLFSGLLRGPGWKLAYYDERGFLFLKNIPKYSHVKKILYP